MAGMTSSSYIGRLKSATATCVMSISRLASASFVMMAWARSAIFGPTRGVRVLKVITATYLGAGIARIAVYVKGIYLKVLTVDTILSNKAHANTLLYIYRRP